MACHLNEQTKKLAPPHAMLYSTAIRVDTLGGNAEWSGPVFLSGEDTTGCFMSFVGA
ncbi:Hypothetical protein, conserved [Brucella abortus str. 2308 A]|uniref:Uncharacterized protein n=2 Tax=Brucella TaxID=234 RepID=C0REH0_BRUMB|nr:Hypothetical protein, conserved [Brucella melitensis ATCC 23457]EEH14185.1 Hypothetical protein, conserved [Brucella ceti str. Cudo]EEP63436.1 Hypothetical protein, conserved [Brucella abortus str. 2308 A]